MATTFKYLRPDETFGTSVSGSVDATYNANWLIDGRPSRPVRYTASGVVYTITGTATDVDFLALGYHALDAALSVSIGGDITDTLTIPAYGANDIPANAYKAITPVSGVDSLTVTVSGNTGSAVIIGEFAAGTTRTLPGTLSRHTGFRRNNFTAQRSLDRAFIPPFDKGMVAKQWTGTLLLTSTQRDDLIAWEESQQSGTRPSIVVIDSAVWWGYLEVGNEIALPGGLLWKIDIRFVEIPRTRW